MSARCVYLRGSGKTLGFWKLLFVCGLRILMTEGWRDKITEVMRNFGIREKEEDERG